MRRSRTGTEPVEARSPLRLRLILASAALVVFAAATVRLAMGAHSAGPHDSPSPTVLLVLAVVCGVLAIVGMLDVVVLIRRLRSERTTGA
ncbi:DUF6343 family protein [Streptomyces sp. NPDC048434]|uniref:DUF6343 family protein n=1 Tax=Streptomyces sp. NPDC048434 TaxID=3365549 RepID=UPI003710A796